MNKYGLNFNIDKSGIAKISVSSAGIAFSRESIELLGKPERVNIGINKKMGYLGVCKAVEDPSIKSYPFVTNDKKVSWLRINSKPLIKVIQQITKIEYGTKAISYVATYDEDESMLIVNLKEKN